MVEFYEVVRLLKSKDYTFVKQYPREELWEKNGNTILVPFRNLTNHEFKRFKRCLI